MINRLSSFSIVAERLSQTRKVQAIRYHFCVPDEWYRRSASKSRPAPLKETIDDSYVLRTSSPEPMSDEEGEGTAKVQSGATGVVTTENPATEFNETMSKNRLSTLFDGWMGGGSANSSPTSSRVDIRKSVSGPILVEKSIPGFASDTIRSHTSLKNDNNNDDQSRASDEFDSHAFEAMMDELGIKSPQREAMRQLPLDRKSYLLHQNAQSRPLKEKTASRPATVQTVGPAGSGPLLSKIAPQLTGESIMKRFSVVGWGSSSPSSTKEDTYISDSASETGSTTSLVAQNTGSLWSSWWNSSGEKDNPDKTSSDSKSTDSPQWYINGIRRWYVRYTLYIWISYIDLR